MSRQGRKLSELVGARMQRFPCSGEINSIVADPPALLRDIEARYADQSLETDWMDGLSMSFGDWRFNIRSSSTEPVVRLNVESRGDEALMRSKTRELLGIIGA